MFYRDVVQFDPIESVIQLRAADDKQAAANLVQTYVVSDRMADQLANIVIPQLQIDRPLDNKGVLVVGNYGTGKSHLMSLISALAEHADLVPMVRNAAVKTAAAAIAGKFMVVRAEIGGVKRSLRDIVLTELQKFFDRVETPYTFPDATQITNNKNSLIDALAQFNTRYPDMGVLFVLDELLDYLRSREERELILDLGFLRELGEVAAVTPFRFMAGVQETLFDNPRFGFVAEQLRRVRDRFEQVRIAREDIAYVVAQRLLHKSDSQLAQIIEHLRPFSKLYPVMAERLNEYARLFPIHPAYIDTFERVYVAEKREVLQTFSRAIRTVLDKPVPSDQTGLISYDHYWQVLTDNASLRTLPGIAEVVTKSNVLEGRIQNAYTRKPLLPMALRIIHALSVHRLTTSDIDAPLGVTAEELRDQLCLWAPLPEPNAEFLSDMVQVALKEIMRTVSGQYISFNGDNGQYYLNLKKDIDFDAKIAERGNFMETRDLNRYFYAALQRLLNVPASAHVTGFNIWPYELPWAARNVTRPGYLFFGPPNERSTAQPPRDFYLYVLPPFGGPNGKHAGENDEVLLQFTGLSDEFTDIVRKYAGAQAMAAESPNYRQTYEDKADDHLRKLLAWLKQNFNNHVRLTSQGVTRSVAEVLAQTRSSASRDAEDLLRVLAAQLLAPHFEDAYPDHPAFTRLLQPLSENARAGAATDAVRFLAGRGRTNLAIAVLDALKLLDNEERIRPLSSPYARYFLDLLLAKGETQVVNQGEVIEQIAGGLTPIFKDCHFKLDPEWVVVTLLALVYDGQMTLNLGGNETLDAGNIERAAVKAMADLTDFRFYRRPKTLPLPVWTQIFDAFGLQSSLLRDETKRDDAVRALQQHVQSELGRIVEWQSRVAGGLTLWNTSLFTDRLAFNVQDGIVQGVERPNVMLSQTELLPYLRTTKEFLEQLSRYDKAGKLRNLPLSTTDADIVLSDRAKALRTQYVIEVITQLQPLTGYLSEAAAVLPTDHEWVKQAGETRESLLADVRRLAKGKGRVDLVDWRKRLDDLRRAYITIYTDLHTASVLGPADDERRSRLMRGPQVEQLKALSDVDILNKLEFQRWGRTILDIPTCRDFHAGLLEDSPVCPRCNFRPSQANTQVTAKRRLDLLIEQLDAIQSQWQAALHTNLASETAQASLRSMTVAERQPIDSYLALADPTNAALPSRFVDSINKALRGLQTVTFSPHDLVAALHDGGMPCTADELTQRFARFMRTIMSGHDQRNTRLTIEHGLGDQ